MAFIVMAGAQSCNTRIKQKSLYVNFNHEPSLTNSPAFDMVADTIWEKLDKLADFGERGIYSAWPITFKRRRDNVRQVGGYMGVQVTADNLNNKENGNVLWSLWDKNTGTADQRIAIPMHENCKRNCNDCAVHEGKTMSDGTTGTKCRTSIPVVQGHTYRMRIRRVQEEATVTDYYNLTVTGSVWEVTLHDIDSDIGEQIVGRQLLEKVDSGLIKLSAFHEHLGCTSCGSFEVAARREGPWVIDPPGTTLVGATAKFDVPKEEIMEEGETACLRQDVVKAGQYGVRFETGGAETAPHWSKTLWADSAGSPKPAPWYVPPTAAPTAAPTSADYCPDSDGLTGFRFSHNGNWGTTARNEGTVTSVQACADICAADVSCAGFHINTKNFNCKSYEDVQGASEVAYGPQVAYEKCKVKVVTAAPTAAPPMIFRCADGVTTFNLNWPMKGVWGSSHRKSGKFQVTLYKDGYAGKIEGTQGRKPGRFITGLRRKLYGVRPREERTATMTHNQNCDKMRYEAVWCAGDTMDTCTSSGVMDHTYGETGFAPAPMEEAAEYESSVPGAEDYGSSVPGAEDYGSSGSGGDVYVSDDDVSVSDDDVSDDDYEEYDEETWVIYEKGDEAVNDPDNADQSDKGAAEASPAKDTAESDADDADAESNAAPTANTPAPEISESTSSKARFNLVTVTSSIVAVVLYLGL
eukprot:CAMPEP_0197843374 /NCGR_PEP_ID=MMETSP1438-20131217/233_1 /TAXON_ID=1461541 /ORGANISM="Pterosperma sp., Strain CCMP1384" /LENGTH=692 /DNA_ID=CAMNT_0043453475 /DNA_START=282 /DNA_END=2360 /DNA_ORIENTATION=+